MDIQHKILPRFAAALAGLALAGAAGTASAQTALPVETLNAAQQAAIDGLAGYKTPANHPFRMAAMVRLSAYGVADPKLVVKRSNSAEAAVYGNRVTGLSSGQVPMLPSWPSEGSLLDGWQRSDLSQGWSTMTERGLPYLYLQGYGSFSAEGSATWNTTVSVPAGNASQEVVVRFVVPPAAVHGLTDRNALALWQSRVRADLLVNGYPAWSSQANRFNVRPSTFNGPLVEDLWLQQFGQRLSFPTDDDDAASANDSTDTSSIIQPSAKKTVYLSLGRFAPGATLELSMILRGAVSTRPHRADSTARCQTYPPSGYSCTRATMTLRSDSVSDAPRIYLVP